jgi:hypothetical protein
MPVCTLLLLLLFAFRFVLSVFLSFSLSKLQTLNTRLPALSNSLNLSQYSLPLELSYSLELSPALEHTLSSSLFVLFSLSPSFALFICFFLLSLFCFFDCVFSVRVLLLLLLMLFCVFSLNMLLLFFFLLSLSLSLISERVPLSVKGSLLLVLFSQTFGVSLSLSSFMSCNISLSWYTHTPTHTLSPPLILTPYWFATVLSCSRSLSLPFTSCSHPQFGRYHCAALLGATHSARRPGPTIRTRAHLCHSAWCIVLCKEQERRIPSSQCLSAWQRQGMLLTT